MLYEVITFEDGVLLFCDWQCENIKERHAKIKKSRFMIIIAYFILFE